MSRANSQWTYCTTSSLRRPPASSRVLVQPATTKLIRRCVAPRRPPTPLPRAMRCTILPLGHTPVIFFTLKIVATFFFNRPRVVERTCKDHGGCTHDREARNCKKKIVKKKSKKACWGWRAMLCYAPKQISNAIWYIFFNKSDVCAAH